jgi:uncharacterized membrane protein affecting hemolysin expression
MSSQKHPMSIYHVMLMVSAIFMLLATILMSIEARRWWDSGPRAQTFVSSKVV